MSKSAIKGYETVNIEGRCYARILRSSARTDNGVDFLTPDDSSFQIALMEHADGELILPHIHNPVVRTIKHTSEVLIVRKGALRVDFYREDHGYLESRILGPGDIILLSEGGHGFKCLEETDMVEVKQGPYAGTNDKMRFDPVPEEQVIIKE